MFAASCIGVICLVMVLEFLRRVQREYNKFISAEYKETVRAGNGRSAKGWNSSSVDRAADSDLSTKQGRLERAESRKGFTVGGRLGKARPKVLQQAVKATIHMLQFAVAYFVMLLAMYYNGNLPSQPFQPDAVPPFFRSSVSKISTPGSNSGALGYIIICIFIGAWIGSFVFGWDQLAVQKEGDGTEVTVCCG